MTDGVILVILNGDTPFLTDNELKIFQGEKISCPVLFLYTNLQIFSFIFHIMVGILYERKRRMQNIFDKKDFYRAMLRGRLPVAEADFVFGQSKGGRLEFFWTPLGTVLRACMDADVDLREIKMYDKSRGAFAIQNTFCGDNLLKIDNGVFVGVSSRLQIQDVVGRDFLIKTEDSSIIARAQMISKPTVDKNVRLVYN